MKVLWLTQFPYPNSNVHPAPWLSSLATELVKKDINLTILSYYSNLKQDEYYEKNGIKFIFLKVPKPKIDLLTLYKIRIKRISAFVKNNYEKYDLIHVHGSESQLESAILNIHIPTILSIQGIIFECYKILPATFSWKTKILWKLASIYEKRNLPKISHFVCRTHWDKKVIKTQNPSAIIYENWEMLRAEFFDELQFSDPRYILFMGGTNVLKGIEEVLLAFNQIKNKIPLKLLILGGGNKSSIENIIKNKKLSLSQADYDFWGPQDANGIKKAFAKSFCLLHPSYIDNSPNSVCEAQLAGLPVIATDVGGVSSLIEHNKTGILVNLDVQEISEAVLYLYNNRELHGNISNAGKILARERHSPEAIVDKTITIYNKLITENSVFKQIEQHKNNIEIQPVSGTDHFNI
jgi:glycosyltransferase involved in cell wall biosynthesis